MGIRSDWSLEVGVATDLNSVTSNSTSLGNGVGAHWGVSVKLCMDSKVVHIGCVHLDLVCCCMGCSFVFPVLQHLVYTGAWFPLHGVHIGSGVGAH